MNYKIRAYLVTRKRLFDIRHVNISIFTYCVASLSGFCVFRGPEADGTVRERPTFSCEVALPPAIFNATLRYHNSNRHLAVTNLRGARCLARYQTPPTGLGPIWYRPPYFLFNLLPRISFICNLPSFYSAVLANYRKKHEQCFILFGCLRGIKWAFPFLFKNPNGLLHQLNLFFSSLWYLYFFYFLQSCNNHNYGKNSGVDERQKLVLRNVSTACFKWANQSRKNKTKKDVRSLWNELPLSLHPPRTSGNSGNRNHDCHDLHAADFCGVYACAETQKIRPSWYDRS